MKYISTITGNLVECTEQDYIDRNLKIKGYIVYVEPIQPVPEPLTPEQLFDSQLCINTLFRKFITSLAVYSDVSSTLVYLLQTKKPDNDGKYFNYFWCIRIYLVQGLQASKISQADYDRVLTAFTEQNINLEDY